MLLLLLWHDLLWWSRRLAHGHVHAHIARRKVIIEHGPWYRARRRTASDDVAVCVVLVWFIHWFCWHVYSKVISSDTDIVIGVDADDILLGVVGKKAMVYGLELVEVLQVGPAPDITVELVREVLALRDLHAAVLGSRDGHTLRVLVLRDQRLLELVQHLALGDLLHERLHSLLAHLVVVRLELEAEQLAYNRRRVVQIADLRGEHGHLK